MPIEKASIKVAQPQDLDIIMRIMDLANQLSLAKSGEPQWTFMEQAQAA